MAHLRVGAAARGPKGQPRAPSKGAPRTRTASGLVTTLGRWVLWCFVAVLLIRGAADLFERQQPAAAVSSARPPAPAWPDDGARAFAADFARAYLSFSPKDPEASADAVRAFVAPELASSVVPEYGEDARRRTVGAVSVARVARVDDRHALITVAASATGGTRYVTVPVARDGGGGLVVSDLPSLTAPPVRASVPAASLESVSSSERGAIEDVTSRFLRAYLAGDAGGLNYLTPAGVRIAALGSEHKLIDVVSLALLAPAKGRTRQVLATARVRDAAGASYALRYRLDVVREDRWLVAAVNSTNKAG
jgi:Conjugative transposon protein TcpC